MQDFSTESLKLHKKYHGKLEIKSKVPLKNRVDLSRAYTPGVGEVSVQIGKNPKLARDYTIKRNAVAIVSDGSAILGLGNLGAKAAIPVMEGKAILMKEFAGIDGFPICLDTQISEEIIRTVKYIAPVFGAINLEDIGAPRCFEIEERLRKELDIPVMHDDQHGTAVVVLAALINVLKLRGDSRTAVKIIINGAGAAGTAVTKLLLRYGFENIVVCDSKGAIYKDRPGGLNDEKKGLAEITNRENIQGNLAQCMKERDIFIGVSKGNIVTPEMVQSMNKNPIIFALANPIPEIMPNVAKKAGAFIVATGRSDFPNQINNVLAFPGIFRGALDNNIKQFTNDMFIKAAEALASCVKKPKVDALLPRLFDKKIAKTIAKVIK